MKSHDFGQFLFNSSTFNETELIRLISESENSKPTLAAKALFLRLVSADELKKVFAESEYNLPENPDDYLHSHEETVQEKYNAIVKSMLTAQQLQRTQKLGNDKSLWLLQKLIDDDAIGFAELEKLLEEYHRLEIPPVENAFAAYYNSLPQNEQIDYPPALDAADYLHAFISESLNTTVVFVPKAEKEKIPMCGASVKIAGVMPVVVAVMAEEKIFHDLANLYDNFVSDSLEDDFDAISEMLNVFTGNFTVKVAAAFGVEEEPEPPRFGRVDPDVDGLKVITGVGAFYIHVGKEELFEQR